ncbi:hypothetical protein [Streptomyces griseosporeus]
MTITNLTDLEPAGFNAYSLRHSPNGPIVAAAPGDGWFIEATLKEGVDPESVQRSWTDRVVAWLVHENGTVVPAVVDEPESGGTWFPTQDDKFDVRIFHPSQRAVSATTMVESSAGPDQG